MSIQVVAWVLEHSEATQGARLVLFALANHADRDGTKAFPSVATLCREARLSERAVQYALRKLERDGHIVRVGQAAKGTSVYRVLMGAKPAGGANSAGVQNSANEGVQPTAPEPSFKSNRPRTASLRKQSGEKSPSDSSSQSSLLCEASPHSETRVREQIKISGKAVNPEAWHLTRSVLGEFNRMTGRDLRLQTSAGQASEAAKRIYGRVRTYPDLSFEDHRRIIANTLRSRWWGDGKPEVGVIYGPRVFETNIARKPTDPSNGRGRKQSISEVMEELGLVKPGPLFAPSEPDYVDAEVVEEEA